MLEISKVGRLSVWRTHNAISPSVIKWFATPPRVPITPVLEVSKKMNPKIKKDKFFRARDSHAEFWTLFCAQCKSKVLLYQKDGHGKLYRCYLNRIFAPSKYADLQVNSKVRGTRDMPPMHCPSCGILFGKPMFHWEGRLAYLLVRGGWSKKIAEDSDGWTLKK